MLPLDTDTLSDAEIQCADRLEKDQSNDYTTKKMCVINVHTANRTNSESSLDILFVTLR